MKLKGPYGDWSQFNQESILPSFCVHPCSNEYYPTDLQVAPTQDLRRKGQAGTAEELEEDFAAEDGVMEEEVVPEDEQSQKKKTRRAAAK